MLAVQMSGVVRPKWGVAMSTADRELDELRRRVDRLEMAVASVEFEGSFWGRVLRLVSIAAISFVVMLLSPGVVTWLWGLVGLRP